MLLEMTPLAPSPWLVHVLGIVVIVVVAVTFLVGGALIVKGAVVSGSDPDRGAELMRKALPIMVLAGAGAVVFGVLANLDTVVPFLERVTQLGSDSFWAFLGGVAATLVVINVILFIARGRER